MLQIFLFPYCIYYCKCPCLYWLFQLSGVRLLKMDAYSFLRSPWCYIFKSSANLRKLFFKCEANMLFKITSFASLSDQNDCPFFDRKTQILLLTTLRLSITSLKPSFQKMDLLKMVLWEFAEDEHFSFLKKEATIYNEIFNTLRARYIQRCSENIQNYSIF